MAIRPGDFQSSAAQQDGRYPSGSTPVRPGENEEARRSYRRDGERAALEGPALDRYVADMLRMDVVEHACEAAGGDDVALYAEWKALRRRTTLPARALRHAA